MKKLRFFIFSLLLFIPAYAELKSPMLFINGNFVDSDVEPIVVSQRTLVPIRIISENIGYSVNWNEKEETVNITNENSSLSFKIGENFYNLNGEKFELDVPSQIISNRTMVPIRMISESFGEKIFWDDPNRVVAIGEGYVDPKLSSNTFEKAKVTKVIDGDTLEIDRGRGRERLRLILVDTPETVHPKKEVQYFGIEASNFTKKWLDKRFVYLEKDVSETDKYGRLLRYVWLVRPSNDTPTEDEVKSFMFNSYLLKGGYANVATFPPDVKYVDIFRSLEKNARETSSGLFGNSGVDVKEINEKKGKDFAFNYANGRIIGNKNSKIYHLPTGKNYNSVYLRNAVFFDSEDAAIKAGYRRAKK